MVPVERVMSVEDGEAEQWDDYEGDDTYDEELYAVNPAEILCDFCKVKGHPLHACEKAKPVINQLAASIKGVARTHGLDSWAIGRLLNAVRRDVKAPFPRPSSAFLRAPFRPYAEGNRK